MIATCPQNRVLRTVLGVLVASSLPSFMAGQALAQNSVPSPHSRVHPHRPPPPPSMTEINDNDPSIVYSRRDICCDQWSIGSNSGNFDGDEHYSAATRDPSPGTQVYGADVVVNFNGTGITWIGRTGPQFGIAAYSVDGGPVSFLDAYSPTVVYQTQNAVISGLSPGSHSLKIEVTSSHNAASSDYYQVVDAFVIQGAGGGGIQPSQTLGAPQMLSGYLSPQNGWGCFAGYPQNPGDLSGYHCTQSIVAEANATLTWSFTGSLLEVYGRPDAENGYSDMYIDGTFIKTVDWVFGTIDDDLINSYCIFTWSGAPGNHTFTLVTTGTTDNAINNFALVQIDTLMAFP